MAIASLRAAAVCSSMLLNASPVRTQALPPPGDGDIRVLHYQLSDRTTVWLTLEPKRTDGKPVPPGMLLTLTLEFPGRRPKAPPQEVEIRAYAGFMWAPQVELSLVLDDREKIDLAPRGMTGLVGGGVSDYLPAPLAIDTLKQIATAKRARIYALGLEFELTDAQRQAVRAFLDRVLSDNPAQFRDHASSHRHARSDRCSRHVADAPSEVMANGALRALPSCTRDWILVAQERHR
jgi:hypothetical protein